jgi:hypothetical protein
MPDCDPAELFFAADGIRWEELDELLSRKLTAKIEAREFEIEDFERLPRQAPAWYNSS